MFKAHRSIPNWIKAGSFVLLLVGSGRNPPESVDGFFTHCMADRGFEVPS